MPDASHDVKVEPKVMERRERGEQNLLRHEQMAKIRSRKRAAGIAVARGVQRTCVISVLGLLDRDFAGGCEKVPVAGVAGRQHTIHHVDAVGDIAWKFIRHPDPHDVTGLVFWEQRHREGGHLLAEISWFPDRKPADGVPGRIEFNKGLSTGATEIRKRGALHDREKSAVPPLFPLQVMFVAETGPIDGAEHRFECGGMVDRVRQAFIQNHHDVAAECELDVDGRLRREKMRIAVEV